MEKYITLDIRCCIVDNKKVSKRGNKQVTIVRGMTSPMDDRKKLLKEMKRKLGGGGSMIEGVVRYDRCDASH